MAWIVGIDEAGYGPNLGPLVQAAVAFLLPDSDPSGWDSLQPWIRCAAEPKDHRLCLDDSKKIYHGVNRFRQLEEGVFTVLGWRPGSFGDLLQRILDPELQGLLSQEYWYQGSEQLPLQSNLPRRQRWPDWWQPGTAAVNLVPALHFNQFVRKFGSKATVLSVGLIRLLQTIRKTLRRGIPGNCGRVIVYGDKHGGRNYYAAMLQQAFPDGWVITERESAAESRYRLTGLEHDWEIVLLPRADATVISVAVASMLAKYLREVCMIQINRFWQHQIPGLRPTAGYPVDARRFLTEIRPHLARLQIPEEAVWRIK